MARSVRTDQGTFSSDGRSFTIHDPRLEGVWEHYLSNDDYCLVLSQSWCGYSFWRSRPLYPVSIGGRLAFVRDEETRQVWSVTEPGGVAGMPPTYEELHGLSGDQSTGSARFRVPLAVPPLPDEPPVITVTWGQGYATLRSVRREIAVTMTLRVAPKNSAELWDIRVENLSRRTRRIALMPATSFHLGAGIWMAGNATVCTYTEIDPSKRSIAARMEGIRLNGAQNIAAVLSAVEGNVDACFGTLDSAQAALLDPDAQPAQAYGEEAIALMRCPMALKPGQSAQVSLVLAVGRDVAEARRVVRRLSTASARKSAARQVDDFWITVAERQLIDTPDQALNRFYNTWLKYEMWQTGRWCRGEGRGYRDTLQDSEGMALLDTDFARQLIEMCLVRQRSDGWAVREFDQTVPQQTSKRDFRDSALWLVYAIDTYVRETGDSAFLDQVFPYMDGRRGTVHEHAVRACEFLVKNHGKHGLPLIAGGDWNDALDHVGISGKGESVWLGIALHRAIAMLIDLIGELPGRRHAAVVRKLSNWSRQVRRAVLTQGWDGKWFRRAFDDTGRVIGSRTCPEGKIFLLPQAWAAFAGLGDEEKIRTALSSADRYLTSDWGPPKLWPGYAKRDTHIGRITVRAAGLGENAGIHTHAVTFKMKADLTMGNADAAYRNLQLVAPIDGHPQSVLPVEPPYVLCNQRVGPEHVDFGSHKNRWLSGSVSWIFRLITQDMLGTKPTLAGLRIAPCLPSNWTSAIQRTFRGAVYDIRITKPAGIQRAQVSLTVDGKPIDGDVLPVLGKGKRCVVECRITAAEK